MVHKEEPPAVNNHQNSKQVRPTFLNISLSFYISLLEKESRESRYRHGREGKIYDFISKQTNTWPSTRKTITDDSSTAAIACFSIIDGILATAASLEARGIPSIPIVVVISRSSITVDCDFETVITPPVSTTMNSWSPQYDRPYKRSLVTPGSSTTIALLPYNLRRE